MGGGTESLQALLDELAGPAADDLLAEALVHARARVLEELTDALTRSIRAHVATSRPAQAPPEAYVPPTAPAAEPAASPAGSVDPSELAWYVYGVIAARDADRADRLPGIEADHLATTVTEGPVAAVASRVQLEEFAETALRAHLSDMGWVEATARAHERTLELLRERATVIPMRICTVYRTEAGLREMLRREQRALEDGLAHLERKTEWGVKVFADSRLSHPNPPASPSTVESEDSPGAGAAYLAQKREERDAAERVGQLIDEAARQIHERLAAAASDGRVVPSQRTDPGRPAMILNGVYLVHEDNEGAFHDQVRELQQTFGPIGLELQPTGPWPAYNFVPGTIGAAW